MRAKELYLKNRKMERKTRQNKYNYVLIPYKKEISKSGTREQSTLKIRSRTTSKLSTI